MSIDIGDLRFNNWVLKSVLNNINDAEPFQITKGYQIDNAEHYYPIGLSSEILGKCKLPEWILIYPSGAPNQGRFGIGIKKTGIITDIDYLHQLQNVVYILSRKELEINLQTI